MTSEPSVVIGSPLEFTLWNRPYITSEEGGSAKILRHADREEQGAIQILRKIFHR